MTGPVPDGESIHRRTLIAKKRKIVDARADEDGDITHVRLDGNTRFTPLNTAMDMAERGDIENAHVVHPRKGSRYLRTNPDKKKRNNLDDMAGDR